MSEILNKYNASISLMRTNPKLSGNVKITVDSDHNITLNSFSANKELSKSMYKGFKTNGGNSYEKDLCLFFNGGATPNNIVFGVYEESPNDGKIKNEYSKQYDTFYGYGAEELISNLYPEEYSLLAPLWLKTIIPDYFVVMKVKDPVSVPSFREIVSGELVDGQKYSMTGDLLITYNGIQYSSSQSFLANSVNSYEVTSGNGIVYNSDENNADSLIRNPKNFKEHILDNAEIIKTFDLTERTQIGKYLRAYQKNSQFPKAPLTISFDPKKFSYFNGISIANGFFTSAAENLNELLQKDNALINFDDSITSGFERNGIAVANLLNLEFLFNDPTSEDYEINRYFGMYVNSIELGSFCVDIEKLKNNYSLSKNFTETNQKTTIINPDNGVVLYADNSTTRGILFDSEKIQNVLSIAYIEDKNKGFHTISPNKNFNDYDYPLQDKSIDLKDFTGFDNSFREEKGSYIFNEKGSKASIVLKITDILKNHDRLDFFNIDFLIGSVKADKLPTIQNFGAGKSHRGTYFYPEGTPEEIAVAISSAINENENLKEHFEAVAFKDGVIVQCKRYGETGERYNVFISNSKSIQTNSNTLKNNFVGGTGFRFSRIKVDSEIIPTLLPDMYLQTEKGFSKIKSITPYLEEPIEDFEKNIVSYKDVDKYSVVYIENTSDTIAINKTKIHFKRLFRPIFGVLSFFPVMDFDCDFFDETYSKTFDSEWTEFFGIQSGNIEKGENYLIIDGLNNNNSSIEYNGLLYGTSIETIPIDFRSAFDVLSIPPNSSQENDVLTAVNNYLDGTYPDRKKRPGVPINANNYLVSDLVNGLPSSQYIYYSDLTTPAVFAQKIEYLIANDSFNLVKGIPSNFADAIADNISFVGGYSSPLDSPDGQKALVKNFIEYWLNSKFPEWKKYSGNAITLSSTTISLTDIDLTAGSPYQYPTNWDIAPLDGFVTKIKTVLFSEPSIVLTRTRQKRNVFIGENDCLGNCVTTFTVNSGNPVILKRKYLEYDLTKKELYSKKLEEIFNVNSSPDCLDYFNFLDFGDVDISCIRSKNIFKQTDWINPSFQTNIENTGAHVLMVNKSGETRLKFQSEETLYSEKLTDFKYVQDLNTNTLGGLIDAFGNSKYDNTIFPFFYSTNVHLNSDDYQYLRWLDDSVVKENPADPTPYVVGRSYKNFQIFAGDNSDAGLLKIVIKRTDSNGNIFDDFALNIESGKSFFKISIAFASFPIVGPSAGTYDVVFTVENKQYYQDTQELFLSIRALPKSLQDIHPSLNYIEWSNLILTPPVHSETETDYTPILANGYELIYKRDSFYFDSTLNVFVAQADSAIVRSHQQSSLDGKVIYLKSATQSLPILLPQTPYVIELGFTATSPNALTFYQQDFEISLADITVPAIVPPFDPTTAISTDIFTKTLNSLWNKTISLNTISISTNTIYDVPVIPYVIDNSSCSKFSDFWFSVVNLQKGDFILSDGNATLIPIEVFKNIVFDKISNYFSLDVSLDFLEDDVFGYANGRIKYSIPYIDLNSVSLEKELKDFPGFFTLFKTSNPQTNNQFSSNAEQKLLALREHELKSEYESYRENYVKELFPKSKTVPTISKWVVHNGTDVRDNPYRLNNHDVFGILNFSPSPNGKEHSALNMTHEWYYLEKYPRSVENKIGTFSYFDYAFDLGLYSRGEFDYFTDYFTVEKIKKTISCVDECSFTIDNNLVQYNFPFTDFDYNISNDTVLDLNGGIISGGDTFFDETFLQNQYKNKIFQPQTPNGRWVNTKPNVIECIIDKKCVNSATWNKLKTQFTVSNSAKIKIKTDVYGTEKVLTLTESFYLSSECLSLIFETEDGTPLWEEPKTKILHYEETTPGDFYEIPQKPISKILKNLCTQQEPVYLYNNSINSNGFPIPVSTPFPEYLPTNHPFLTDVYNVPSIILTLGGSPNSIYPIVFNFPPLVIPNKGNFNNQTLYEDIVLKISPYTLNNLNQTQPFDAMLTIPASELTVGIHPNSTYSPPNLEIVDGGVSSIVVLGNSIDVKKIILKNTGGEQETIFVYLTDFKIPNPDYYVFVAPTLPTTVSFDWKNALQIYVSRIDLCTNQKTARINPSVFYKNSEIPSLSIPQYKVEGSKKYLRNVVVYDGSGSLNVDLTSGQYDLKITQPPSNIEKSTTRLPFEVPLQSLTIDLEATTGKVNIPDFIIRSNVLGDNSIVFTLPTLLDPDSYVLSLPLNDLILDSSYSQSISSVKHTWKYADVVVKRNEIIVQSLEGKKLQDLQLGDLIEILIPEIEFFTKSLSSNNSAVDNIVVLDSLSDDLGETYYPSYYDAFSKELRLPELLNPESSEFNSAATTPKNLYRCEAFYHYNGTTTSQRYYNSYQHPGFSLNTQTITVGSFYYKIKDSAVNLPSITAIPSVNVGEKEFLLEIVVGTLNFDMNDNNPFVVKEIPMGNLFLHGAPVGYTVSWSGTNGIVIKKGSEIVHTLFINRLLKVDNPAFYTEYEYQSPTKPIPYDYASPNSKKRTLYVLAHLLEVYQAKNNPIEFIFSCPKTEDVTIKTQDRFTIFEYDKGLQHSKTFFKGSKIIIKERVNPKEVLDFNPKDISTIKGSKRFNDYKFSSLLKIKSNENGVVESPYKISFIENKKFKTILCLVEVFIEDYKLLDGEFIFTEKSLQKTAFSGSYTALYSLNSLKWRKTHFNFFRDDYKNGLPMYYNLPLPNPTLDKTFPFFFYGVQMNNQLNWNKVTSSSIVTLEDSNNSYLNQQINALSDVTVTLKNLTGVTIPFDLASQETFPAGIEIVTNQTSELGSIIYQNTGNIIGRVGKRDYQYSYDVNLAVGETIQARPYTSFGYLLPSSFNPPAANFYNSNQNKISAIKGNNTIEGFGLVNKEKIFGVYDQSLYYNFISLSGLSFFEKDLYYTYENGGENFYRELIKEISFGNIFELVNSGNPKVEYVSYSFDEITYNTEKTTGEFIIEFIPPDIQFKKTKLNVVDDVDKPSELVFEPQIGYSLEESQLNNPKSYLRYSESYEPKMKDVLCFTSDEIDLTWDFTAGNWDKFITNLNPTSSEIESLKSDFLNRSIDHIFNNQNKLTQSPNMFLNSFVKDNINWNELNDCMSLFSNPCVKLNYKGLRFRNTVFNLLEDFGKMKNVWYHKVNENNQSVLRLYNNNAYPSLYPLLDETAIDKRDFYVFESSWDSGYYRIFLGNNNQLAVIGTRSAKEKKSFMGSKAMKLPAKFRLETFSVQQITDFSLITPTLLEQYDGFFTVNGNVLTLRIYNQKRIVQLFKEKVTDLFKKFINPLWSFASNSTLEDDVTSYITSNILPAYEISDIILFESKYKNNVNNLQIIETGLDDVSKIKKGLAPNKNIHANKLSKFDFEMTYNLPPNVFTTLAISLDVGRI